MALGSGELSKDIWDEGDGVHDDDVIGEWVEMPIGVAEDDTQGLSVPDVEGRP